MAKAGGIAATLALAAGLIGCASLRQPVTRFALDYNRAIADARNQVMLLNIVRAMNREPLSFSAVSSVEATLTLSGTANVGGTAGIGTGTTGSISPSVAFTGTSSPTLTIVPLNTADFANGMLRPVTPEVVRLFRSQGWRDELLAPLLVAKIECGEDGRITVPNRADPEAFALFSSLKFREEPGAKPNDPSYSLGPDGKLKLDHPLQGGFVVPVDGSTVTGLLTQNFDQSFNVSEAAIAEGKVVLTVTRSGEGALVLDLPPALKSRCGLAGAPRAVALTGPAPPKPGPVIRAYLRSPEAVVYYLGELARSRVETRVATPAGPDGAGGFDARLFALREGARGDDAIRVTHGGRTFAIGPDPAVARQGAPSDRSLQVIELIDQLVALETAPDTVKRAPATVRVR